VSRPLATVRRKRWPAIGAAALAVGALALATCACEEFLGLTTPPKGAVRLGNGTLVVFPFATPKRSHFESDVGRVFAKVVGDLVRVNCLGAKVLDPDDLPATIEGRAIATVPLLRTAKALGATYAVIGEIHELRAKEPGSYRVLKGTMVMSARIYDARKGALVWQIVQRKYHYPRLLGTEAVPAETQDEEVVIRKVMREAAWGIVSVFRGPRTDQELLRDS